MQSKPSRGLFINSSCRRSGILKTLLRGLRHGQAQGAAGSGIYEYGSGASSSPGEKGVETGKEHIRKAVSL